MVSIRDWLVLERLYKENRHVPYKKPEVVKSNSFQLDTAKNITLAEYDPSAQGLITAHRLRDYRRKHFTLVLLPDIEIEIDAYTAPLEVTDGRLL